MELYQFVTILGALIGCFVYMISEMRIIEREIKDESNKQSARTDKLYEMFISLLQEKKL